MHFSGFVPFFESRPFIEFEICLNDGRIIRIAQPELVFIPAGEIGLSIVHTDGVVEFVEAQAMTSYRSASPRDLSDLYTEK